MGEKIFFIVFTSAFLVGGFASMFQAGKDYKYGYESNNWPSVNAVVLESRVTTYGSGSGFSNKVCPSPKIVYEYMIADETKTSRSIRFEHMNECSRREADSLVSMYKIGQQVKAYYNPNNPNIAVLIPGRHLTHAKFLFGLGLFFSVIGLGLVWVGVYHYFD